MMSRLDAEPALQTSSSPESVPDKGSTELRAVTSHDSTFPITQSHEHDTDSPPQYRLYKRRFIGLAQLVLLNIIVSWDWLTFAAASTTSANFFNVSEDSINWLSTGFLFAFVVISPLVLWTLNKGGPKHSIIVASALILVGNWIRYGGTRAQPPKYGVVLFAQILIGFAQPFVLAAPTRYSNLWFSDTGRVSATAVASLANPFGGALGQLIDPFWATNKEGVPNMVLYVAIISTIASLPAPFIPKEPPTPPSAIAAAEKLDLQRALRELPKNVSFYLILIPFSVYVGFFNALSSLVNQILRPYGFSETDAGIAGALLIVVGLVAAAIVSPFVDRTKNYLWTLWTLVPVIAISYLILIFMPGTRTLAGPYVVFSILGASSFSLLPCALEYLVVVTHPVSAEVTSVICWTFGQLLGGIFIIIMNALRGPGGEFPGQPPKTMIRALIFQAVLACVVVPFPMFLSLRRLRPRTFDVGR